MEPRLPRRVQVPLVSAVAVHALLAALIGAGTLYCTGWSIESNNKALLGLRLGGYLISSGGAVYAVVKRRYLVSACCLVAASLFYIWLETGWLFLQPAFSQPSKLATIPLLVALVVLLIPHSPAFNQPGPGRARA